jgi:uncharacterized protein YebE (UPF0316 family)
MDFYEFLLESEFRFKGESVGIITAFNPQGKKISTTRNKQLNLDLAADLRATGFDPWSIKGQYNGHVEDTFVVPNITRNELVKYAKKYDQKAVIWAKKEKQGYAVEWIEKGKTIKKEQLKNIRSLIKKKI